MSISPSLSGGEVDVEARGAFDELPSPVGCGEIDRRGEANITKPSLSFGDSDRGLSMSISLLCRSISRGRFPSTEAGERAGDLGDRGDGSETGNREGPSSTRVASVSFDESVPPLSASSSSSSLDVTSASLASSTVGVTAAVSQYSRFENSSES
jgi:hypothetical protein